MNVFLRCETSINNYQSYIYIYTLFWDVKLVSIIINMQVLRWIFFKNPSCRDATRGRNCWSFPWKLVVVCSQCGQGCNRKWAVGQFVGQWRIVSLLFHRCRSVFWTMFEPNAKYRSSLVWNNSSQFRMPCRETCSQLPKPPVSSQKNSRYSS